MDEIERKQKAREYARKWRVKNPEKQKAIKKREYAKNSQKMLAKRKLWYAENRDTVLKKQKEDRDANHDRFITKQRARRAADPGKFLRYQRSHKAANPHLWRLYGVKRTAKTKGLAFDLDAEWIKQRMDAGICELSGLPFDLSEGGRGPNAPSVDRRDPKGGYTKANCRVIIWWLNRALSNLGEEYSLSVFRAIFVKRGEILSYEDRMVA